MADIDPDYAHSYGLPSPDSWLGMLADLISYDTFCDDEGVDGNLTMELDTFNGRDRLTVTYAPFSEVTDRPARIERYLLTRLPETETP